jgi:hypothetical protein
MKRLIVNVALYFAILPTAYTILMVVVDRKLTPWQLWPLYYLFSTPTWPFALLVVPAMEALIWSATRRSSRVPVRPLTVLLGAVIGAAASFISPIAGLVLGMAGALFGLAYRLPAPLTPMQQNVVARG